MQIQEIWQRYQVIDSSSHPITLQEVQTQPAKTENFFISDTFIAQSGSFLAFLVFWGGILIIFTKKLKLLSENQLTEPMNDCANLPCIRCHYFARNHYLKCAVQPAIALTKDANTCSDYHPKREVASGD
ncbi:hypothetical protein H6G41_19040 [Tolypothrix sp. FACHB-123]|uniref:hypothetical protein n=1 Tax=Tolypothrix sp. FACHB-123 TaxID=2692868 RepID=UPI0016890571|nr:hypothetical protein [Tolypothrix sp. FACHB-123]MBD2356698.1 hypothetical protein [Tolypothrix sp. FACHB-123]